MEKKQLPLRQIGVIVAILVLLVLVLMNYETIYNKLTSWMPAPKEEFWDETDYKAVDELTVVIEPENRSVKITFDDVKPDSSTRPTRTGYVIVLAKYDNQLKEVDAMNVKVSKETNQPTTTSIASGATSTTTAQRISAICNADNVCTYTFDDLQAKDENGNPYYYRLGVGVVYSSTTKGEEMSLITPYSFGPGGRQSYFRVDISQQEQVNLIKQLEEIQKAKVFKPEAGQQNVPSPTGTEPDIEAYMRMLRPYVGNYPDEFTLTKNDIKDLTLDKYLGQSMALGQFNINVDIADLQTQTTAPPVPTL